MGSPRLRPSTFGESSVFCAACLLGARPRSYPLLWAAAATHEAWHLAVAHTSSRCHVQPCCVRGHSHGINACVPAMPHTAAIVVSATARLVCEASSCAKIPLARLNHQSHL